MTHKSRYPGYHNNTNREYLTDEEESHRAPSDRTISEYIRINERAATVKPTSSGEKDHGEKYIGRDEEKRSRSTHNCRGSLLSESSRQSPRQHNNSGSHGNVYDAGSDIYVTSAAFRATSDISGRGSHHSLAPSSRMGYRAPPSHYSYGSARSGDSTVKTHHTSRKGGIVVETMSTPNPFCPNTKGVCCLMLLLNLGLILITLGFVIVIQFFQPLVVWILGIIFLVFGFVTLVGSLIYCVHVFRNAKHPQDINAEDLYWTRYWQGHVGSVPEVYYKTDDKYQDDRYSERASKYSNKYYDRHNERY